MAPRAALGAEAIDDEEAQIVHSVVSKKARVWSDSPWVSASTVAGSVSPPSFPSTSTIAPSKDSSLWSVDTPSGPLSGISTPSPHKLIAKRLDFASSDLQCPLLAVNNDYEASSLEQPRRIYWEAFFVVIPVFCGYASLFGMQKHLKAELGIQEGGSDLSYEFSFAVSMVYMGNLLSRFGHNVLLFWIPPRGRVFLALGCMMVSMSIIAVLIFGMHSKSLALVVLAYALGGLSIGTFESNVLACLTPLGHETKCIAITAIPGGIAAVMIGGFLAMGPPLNVPPVVIYVVVAGLIASAALVMAFRIPDLSKERAPAEAGQGQTSTDSCERSAFVSELRQWRRWLPQVWHYALASTVDMFTLAVFAPGVLLYVYGSKHVEITPGWTMETDSFMAIVNVGSFLGGLAGRSMSYSVKERHPLKYCLVNVVGVVLVLTMIPALAPLGTFLILVGDGLIYGSVSKHIDTVFPAEFNLVAISTWLFIGDFGAVAGASSLNFISQVVAAR